MKWVMGIVVSLVAIVGVIALIGYFLPVSHQASRGAEFGRSPQEVFALISDLPHYQDWWPEFDTHVVVVESVPPTRLVTKIVDETAFGGTWTMDIEPTPAGARLTITERGEVYNVVFRTLSRFVFGHTTTIESCLEAAKKKLSAHLDKNQFPTRITSRPESRPDRHHFPAGLFTSARPASWRSVPATSGGRHLNARESPRG